LKKEKKNGENQKKWFEKSIKKKIERENDIS